MKQSMHIRAIDWALSKGYLMSVTDLCCSVFNDDPDDDEWDVEFSDDRAEIIAATEATDVPNVYIFESKTVNSHICTFSVIDEGQPDETINDYTVSDDPRAQEFDQWFSDACSDY